MQRKRRQPAPNFRMPGAPFNPTTGQHAQLTPFPAKGTTLGFFQVIGDDPNDPDTADTHDNYVVCRGYESESDPEHRFLHDPYTVSTTTPIMVAKPYGVRGTFPYVQGQIIVAARIKGKLGYNPGKAVTVGQPADLDEAISLLTDDDDVDISWLDISTVRSRPSYAHNSTSIAGSAGTIEDATVVDIAYGYGADAGGSFSWGGVGDRELTWNGVTGAKAIVTWNLRLQFIGRPAHNEVYRFGVRKDLGAGFDADVNSLPLFSEFSMSLGDGTLGNDWYSFPLHFATPFTLTNGVKYKLSAQRTNGSTDLEISDAYFGMQCYTD